MKFKHSLFALFFFFCAAGSFAQQAQPESRDYANYPHWQEMMMDRSVNFYETQKAFYAYWQGRTPTRGTGYKVFKRWEYYWQYRINPDGTFPEAGKTYREFNRWAGENLADGRMKSGNLTWTELGPKTRQNYGGYNGVGRVNTIAFHPTDPLTLYVGAPAGGFWYSHDGGATWATSTDTIPTIGVSAIAVSSLDPNTILIGTGDDDGGNDQGLGFFISHDGGLSWTESNNGMVHATVCMFAQHEEDPNTLLAATKDNGIYKTTDFGATWTKTGAPNSTFRDIKYKPGDPSVVYASENGFWRSADGGETWTQIGADQGLTEVGRTVIDVTPANDSLVYALVGGGPLRGLFQSRDFGQTFTLKSDSPNILGYDYDGGDDGSQAWYDLMIHADHTNPNTILVGGVNIWKSTNGGVNWTITSHWWGDRTNEVHADQHHFAFNEVNNRLYAGNDGGIYWSANNGATWTEISEGLGIGQMYKLGVSLTNRNKIVAGFQDNGTATYMAPNWYSTGGGDGMECAVDPFDANYSYTTIYYGRIERRYNNGNTVTVAGENVNGITESGAWVTPFLISETDPNVMVVGMKNVWISKNVRAASGVAFTKISNNLGGSNTTNGAVLEQSPADPGMLFYVRDDGKVFRTNNMFEGTVKWTELTNGKPGGGTPSDLECHPFKSNVVYMTLGTKVYKSETFGATWKDISGSLPDIRINDIAYDKTANEGLYVGTDAGVYYKDADLDDWVLHGTGLPVSVEVSEVEIYWDRVDRGESRVRVSTFGRGMWEVGLAETDGKLPPVMLTATAGTEYIELAWEAPFYTQNITEYVIYRNDVPYATSSGTSYLDREVENEVTYTYSVSAKYAGIGESLPSNTASATPVGDIELPYAQDFEKGNAGWQAKYSFDGWQYGNSSDLTITGNDGYFFGINSGMAGAGVHVIDTLATPKIDLSMHAGRTVTMKFRYTLRTYLNYDKLFLAYKDPVGLRWNLVEEIRKPSGFGWPWGEFEMDLPQDWLVKDIQIGIFYDDTNQHGWGAGVDDFQLFVNTSSVFDLELASGLTIYPNPSQGQFEMNLKLPGAGKLSLSILDMTGKEVYRNTVGMTNGIYQNQIDLTGEASGVYTLIVRHGDREHREKLTIQ